MDGMQRLRNTVLNEEFESELNKKLLENKHGRWQLRIDKTNFCEHYEAQLLQHSKLTKHQRDKLEEIQDAMLKKTHRIVHVHVNANAGTGKTFLAVHLVIGTLKETKETKGQILFIAPTLQLCLYFVRWLGRRGKDEKLPLTDLLERIVVYTPEKSFLKLEIQGKKLKELQDSDCRLCNTEFDLTVVDEAHDIYRDDVLESGFLEKVKTKRWLLLSNISQSSVLTPKFPEHMEEVRLTEVVRCTKRIVAGSVAFHATERDKEELTSLCPDGPPMKTFLFKGTDEKSDYVTYAQKSVAAIRYIAHAYPGLSLHRRLALLVSDDHFRKEFESKLQEALKIGERRFGITNLQDSMSVLPPDLLLLEDQGSEKRDDQEMIILDTVEHAKGLEQLFVICIDLDSEIKGNGSESDAETRARIYQGLTRAQLQAVVVNKLVKGGWFEFLGLIQPEVHNFEEHTAMEETTATPANQIISEGKQKDKLKWEPKEELKEKQGQLEVQGEEKQQKHQEDQREEHQAEHLKEQGPAKVPQVGSMVWDTSEVDPAARENQPTNFNPIVKAGWKHDAGMSNFSVVTGAWGNWM